MKLLSYKSGLIIFENEDGKTHRKDGPAVVRADGSKAWYLNGKQISEQEHARMVAKMKEKSGKS